ncbi:hypothetical protein [Halobacterium yunchengense]|uniref:hypothetical protein n=1 Tax=Halobacterium yunchengense TaxID=3108497 RepID=UPI00300ACEA9
MTDDDGGGFDAGASGTHGDPKFLFALNAVLSTLFAVVVTWGLSFLELVEFTLVNVATLAILLFAATYLVTS